MGCTTIEWYLDAIYPGLKADISTVVSRFQRHVQNNQFLSEALQATVDMYNQVPKYNHPLHPNSGGAGYVVNRRALEILGENLDRPHCFPHQHGFWEDVNVANCLLHSAEIAPYDTRGPLQWERFHPFSPGNHLTYRINEKNPDWYANYNPGLKTGYECCSDASISFHYCPAQLMYTLYDYVYYCEHKVTSERA